MKRTVLIFGWISGAVSSGMMVATVPFIDKLDFDEGASSATPRWCSRRW